MKIISSSEDRELGKVNILPYSSRMRGFLTKWIDDIVNAFVSKFPSVISHSHSVSIRSLREKH